MQTVTIITGASSGIGKAIALSLAEPGRSLVLTARGNVEGLDAVVQEVTKRGALATGILQDLSVKGGGTRVVQEAKEAYGHIDQIVSNAGHAHKALVSELTNEDLDHSIALNTTPFLEMVREAKDDLEASEIGRVVAISSIVTQRFGFNDTLFSATAAAKSATVALAKNLAYELALSGTTVNCVSPGYTAKDEGRGTMNPEVWRKAAASAPNGRVATPQDIAAAVRFFLSAEASHITGQVLNVDGGSTLV